MPPHLSKRPLVAWLLAASLSVSLVGCGAISAQNPSGAYTPVNAVADNPETSLLLKGADVTAYFTEGKYLQGSPEFRSRFEGVDLRFASAQNKALFEQSPTKYLPQYGGYCANGLVYGIPWGGDANTWKIIDGKLYIFGGPMSKDAFELDEKQNLAHADKYWNEEVKGSNSFLQRGWRMVFRVPHYKSSEEIAQLVAAAKANAKP